MKGNINIERFCKKNYKLLAFTEAQVEILILENEQKKKHNFNSSFISNCTHKWTKSTYSGIKKKKKDYLFRLIPNFKIKREKKEKKKEGLDCACMIHLQILN